MVTANLTDGIVAPPQNLLGDCSIPNRGMDNGIADESLPCGVRSATQRLIEAAKLRWPKFGPWRVVMTYREDGVVEWMLRGRSWKTPDVGDKARIGATLGELERRVLVDMDN